MGYIEAEPILISPLYVSGTLRADFKVEVVYQTQAEAKAKASADRRVVETFGSMPTEAQLRYPATFDGTKWVKAAAIDKTDSRLMSTFRLDDAPGYEDGLYRNPNVNSDTAFSPPVRTTD